MRGGNLADAMARRGALGCSVRVATRWAASLSWSLVLSRGGAGLVVVRAWRHGGFIWVARLTWRGVSVRARAVTVRKR